MTRMTSFLAGAGLRLLAVFLITAMSAVVHAVGKDASLGQIMFWRSAIGLLPITVYMLLRREFPSALRSRRPGLHLTRGVFGGLSMALSFLSFIYLPVANAQALAYLAPVLTVPVAALLLGERVGRGLVIVMALGFGGVVAMLWGALERPGPGMLIGIASGLGYAVTMAFVRVHIKAMTATESVGAIAFYFAVISAVIGLCLSPFGWPELSAETLALLALAGLLGGLGHIASTEAVARAPVSAIAPFDFTGLVWAVGFDLVLFGLLPGPASVVGMGAILAAAVLVTAQQGGGARRRPDPAA